MKKSQSLDTALDVAVGVIKHKSGAILLSKRAQSAHMGGRWEFPGGKVEKGEGILEALLRELNEELGLCFDSNLFARFDAASRTQSNSAPYENITPLITITYQYPSKKVKLHVFEIVLEDSWLPDQLSPESNHLTGSEDQVCKWFRVSDLCTLHFPDANAPIVSAVMLPRFMPISQDFNAPHELAARVNSFNSNHYPMFHLRSTQLSQSLFRQYLSQLSLGDESKSNESVVLNCSFDTYKTLDFKHLHLTSKELKLCHKLDEFSIKKGGMLSASCHNEDELFLAQSLGANYVFFSPIKKTSSHPDATPRGWQALADFCEKASIPVYALGGLDKNDLKKAIQCGAQGVAGISQFN